MLEEVRVRMLFTSKRNDSTDGTQIRQQMRSPTWIVCGKYKVRGELSIWYSEVHSKDI